MTLPVQVACKQVLDLLGWALCRQCLIPHRHPCPENILGYCRSLVFPSGTVMLPSLQRSDGSAEMSSSGRMRIATDAGTQESLSAGPYTFS